MSIHTIPVPHGMSVEVAWEMIKNGDKLNDPDPRWANIEVDKKGNFVHLFEIEEEDEPI